LNGACFGAWQGRVLATARQTIDGQRQNGQGLTSTHVYKSAWILACGKKRKQDLRGFMDKSSWSAGHGADWREFGRRPRSALG
jgi:hypothetical protein